MDEPVLDLDIGLTGVCRDATVQIEATAAISLAVLTPDQNYGTQGAGLFDLKLYSSGVGSQRFAIVLEA